MISKTINNEGHWDSFWTEELKEALKKAETNDNVGEYLLLETESFKVWSISLEKGKSLPFHKHNKPYFYTANRKGKSRSFFSNGKIVETEYETNDIKHFKNLSEDHYFIHNLENIGSTTLKFTTVEFKK
ncbi:hypothetical protein [Lacinutrix salivirga]